MRLLLDLENCLRIAILFQILRRILAGVNIVMRHFLAGVNIVMRHFLGGVRIVMRHFLAGVHIAMRHFGVASSSIETVQVFRFTDF